MADVPERLARQESFTPTEARDICSADQHRYLDPVPGMQAKYARDPVYSGRDAERRYRDGE